MIILRPYRALNSTVILYPGRCPGLKYFPLLGEIRFNDTPSESLIIIDKNKEMYIE